MTDNNQHGFLFLELLIAIALVSVVFVVLLGIGVSSLSVSSSLKAKTQENQLVQESLEAVRSFRDGSTWDTDGLGTLAAGSANPYCPEQSGSSWVMTPGDCAPQNGFTRSVTVDRVSRDPNTDAIESAYNAVDDDPNTRKITATITSDKESYAVVTYLTDWKG